MDTVLYSPTSHWLLKPIMVFLVYCQELVEEWINLDLFEPMKEKTFLGTLWKEVLPLTERVDRLA